VFGDLLGKLFDRLAASSARAPAAEGELDASLFQARAATRDALSARPEPVDDRDLPSRARADADDRDEDGRDAVAAAVESPPQPIPADVDDAATAAADESVDAAPHAQGKTTAPVDATTLADAASDARAATLALKKLPDAAAHAPNPPQPGQGAEHAQLNPIKVTVTAAPVRPQADQPLAASAALGAQTGEGEAVDLDAAAPTTNATASVVGGPSTGGPGAGGQHSATGGPGSQANQGQGGANFLAAATPAAGAAAMIAAPVPASFAAQLDASSADLAGDEGTHRIFAAAPGTTPGTANALRNTSGTPALPQLPRLSALDQIAVDIKKAIAAGKDQITINLKPADLGRIEVKLEVGADGQVSAQVRAERPETLELLQRDARGLERALQEAGLRADSGTLSFGLRGENGPHGQNGANQNGDQRFGDPTDRHDQAADEAANASPAPIAARLGDGRVDLHV